MINTFKNIILQTAFQRGFEYALVVAIKAVALMGVVGVAVVHLAGRHVEKMVDSFQRKLGLQGGDKVPASGDQHR
jgi:hypothetical protein